MKTDTIENNRAALLIKSKKVGFGETQTKQFSLFKTAEINLEKELLSSDLDDFNLYFGPKVD